MPEDKVLASPNTDTVEAEEDPELAALQQYADEVGPCLETVDKWEDEDEGAEREQENGDIATTTAEDGHNQGGYVLYPHSSSEGRTDWSKYLRKAANG